MLSRLVLLLLTLLALTMLAAARPQADPFTSGTITQPWGGAVPSWGTLYTSFNSYPRAF